MRKLNVCPQDQAAWMWKDGSAAPPAVSLGEVASLRLPFLGCKVELITEPIS